LVANLRKFDQSGISLKLNVVGFYKPLLYNVTYR
jgi:hypothetical protein